MIRLGLLWGVGGRAVTYTFYRWSCPDGLHASSFLSARPSSVSAEGFALLTCPFNVAGSWDGALDPFSQLTTVPPRAVLPTFTFSLPSTRGWCLSSRSQPPSLFGLLPSLPSTNTH